MWRTGQEDRHIWRTTFLSSWCWMSLFVLKINLDLCKANKSLWGRKKERKGSWWHYSWTYVGDLLHKAKAKERLALDNEKHKICLFFVFFCLVLFFSHMYASRAAHVAVRNKGSTVEHLWWRERTKKKREKEQLLVGGVGGGGWTESLHIDGWLWKERITCAHLLSCHILIPSQALWEPTLRPFAGHRVTPATSLQSFSSVPVSISAAVCCQVSPHKNLYQSHPNIWPAPRLSRTAGGVKRKGFVMLCMVYVPFIFTTNGKDYKKHKPKKIRNVLFKVFIFKGWLCWNSKSRDLVAVLY